MRAKITPIWAKIRMVTSPAWWKSKGIATLRQFFSKLFDVKPRHKKDY